MLRRVFNVNRGSPIFAGLRCFSTRLNLEQTLKIVEKEGNNTPQDILSNFNQIINAFHVDTTQGYLLKSKPALEFFHRMGSRIQALDAEETFKVLATCARVQSVPEGVREPLFESLYHLIESPSELSTDRVLQTLLILSSLHADGTDVLVDACITRLMTDLANPSTLVSGQSVLACLVGLGNLGMSGADELLSALAHKVETLENQGTPVVSSLPTAHKVSLLVALASLNSPSVLAHFMASQLAGQSLSELRPHQIADVLEATATLQLDSFSMLTALCRRVETEASLWSSFDGLRVLQGLVRHKGLEINGAARLALIKNVTALRLPSAEGSVSLESFVTKFDARLSLELCVNALRYTSLTETETVIVDQLEADLRSCKVPSRAARTPQGNDQLLADVVREAAILHRGGYVERDVSLLNGLVLADLVVAPTKEQVASLISKGVTDMRDSLFSFDAPYVPPAITLPSFGAASSLLAGLHRPMVFVNKSRVESASLPSQADVLKMQIRQLGADVAWIDETVWRDAVMHMGDSESVDAALLETMAAGDLVTFELGEDQN